MGGWRKAATNPNEQLKGMTTKLGKMDKVR